MPENSIPKPRKTGVKKPGSGRTKGAVSIVTVTLRDLQKTFANPSARIAVSRKFIEQFGLNYQLMDGQNTPDERPEPVQVKANSRK